jgi:hypothetical protein
MIKYKGLAPHGRRVAAVHTACGVLLEHAWRAREVMEIDKARPCFVFKVAEMLQLATPSCLAAHPGLCLTSFPILHCFSESLEI